MITAKQVLQVCEEEEYKVGDRLSWKHSSGEEVHGVVAQVDPNHGILVEWDHGVKMWYKGPWLKRNVKKS